jgi:methyltransferase family protein
VLAQSVRRLLDTLPDDAVVLDIGAWGRPFRRADWVLDHMPYETRGLYGFDGDEPERFDVSRWVVRDVCSREPFPFADKEIDFVICSHTLEDVRDPIWVCQEMVRIAKAGYIEVPSRVEEQTYGVQGDWVGWGHHHWLVDISGNNIDFFFKHHIVHGKPHARFPAGYLDGVPAEDRVQTLWWQDSFTATEKSFSRPEDTDAYLESFVAAQLQRRPARPTPPAHSLVRRGIAKASRIATKGRRS